LQKLSFEGEKKAPFRKEAKIIFQKIEKRNKKERDINIAK